MVDCFDIQLMVFLIFAKTKHGRILTMASEHHTFSIELFI